MKIKTGDKIKMLAGKDKGKTGKVLQVMAADNKVVVEGLNLLIKHQRPKRSGEKGQRIQFPAAVAMAKVALVCPKCGQAARVGYKLVEDKKFRFCKKCKETI
ncbi:MAG: 50S ribosomal protein L24 [Patescibacteria group bacterium]|jgi:large subunit ribosomal protein L24